MKLPNRGRAQISKEKIAAYLLSPTHRDGRHKAAFFRHYGFSAEDWQELATALRRHAAENDVVRIDRTPFGVRYVVEGQLPTPSGGAPNVRAVWFVAEGAAIPHLVTCYPVGREKGLGRS